MSHSPELLDALCVEICFWFWSPHCLLFRGYREIPSRLLLPQRSGFCRCTLHIVCEIALAWIEAAHRISHSAQSPPSEVIRNTMTVHRASETFTDPSAAIEHDGREGISITS